jgi:DNA-binding phage protein
MTKLKKFEASPYLTDGETIRAILTACQEDDDPEVHARAAQEIDAAKSQVLGHLRTAQLTGAEAT